MDEVGEGLAAVKDRRFALNLYFGVVGVCFVFPLLICSFVIGGIPNEWPVAVLNSLFCVGEAARARIHAAPRVCII